ncbi:MAG: hypothetical protein R3F16_01110 [Myxococcota bacterium]
MRVLRLWIVLSLLAASPTFADLLVSAGGGVFDPWKGSPGYEVSASLLGTYEDMPYLRVGIELAHRRAEAKVVKAWNVDFESYRFSVVLHGCLLPDVPVQPYLGGRVTVAYNDGDAGDVELRRPDYDVQRSDTPGLGAALLAGLDVPLGGRVVLFGEVSVGTDVLATEGKNDRRRDAPRSDGDGIDLSPHFDLPPFTGDEIGGVSGVAGLRFRF